jgi:predicted site-specific integrase-resolvase
MADSTQESQRSWEPWPRYAKRRGVSTKTLDRWVSAGRLDPPERINGRKYASVSTEPRRDGEAATQ